jgi:OPA family glycerol-3-phosphate transporter-like MFS transporter
MYFQSYGAVSIIKVKAYWFHVRERGIFGAIFGTLISFGVYFAFDWGQMIVEATKATVTGQLTFVQLAIRRLFIVEGATTDATWLVFFIPAAIMLIWAVIDVFFIKDTPEGAGFQPLDTCDASSGTGDKEYSTRELLGKVFKSPIMMTIAFVELTSGVLRNGIMQWYLVFAKEVNMAGSEFFVRNWGLLLCMTGIVGGFAAGIISDHVFQSRRGPPAAIMCGFMVVLTVVMAIFLFKSPVIVGTAAVLMTLAVIGVHSIMSGTAAADFGGKKATGTCSGIVDGFVYLGSGIQSFCIGYMTSWSWELWPIFLIPFALLGLYLSLKLWKQLPTATRKYNESMEKKKIPAIVIEADEDLEEATT